jgi:Tfp pilus assembly protein PilN
VQDCDFIPSGYHESRRLRRALRLRAMCVVILITIMGTWVVFHRQRLAVAQDLLADLGRQRGQIAIHLTNKQSMEVQRERLRDRRRLIERLQDQPSLVVLLSDISRRLPETMVLTRLDVNCPSFSTYAADDEPAATPDTRTSPAKSWADRSERRAAKPTPARVTLTGIAREAPEVYGFVRALEGSPLVDEVRMEVNRPASWAGRQVQLFELKCDLVAQQWSAR